VAEVSPPGEGAQLVAEVAAGLELPVQLLYLSGILTLLGAASYFVVTQAIQRRELEMAAKDLGERIRTGTASGQDYFEMGAVMVRKKVYTQSIKYLRQALEQWDGEEQELALVRNALGFSLQQQDKADEALEEFKLAVKIQPGYTTAWNNMADVYEKRRDYKNALKAYEETLTYDPDNKIANERIGYLRTRVRNITGY